MRIIYAATARIPSRTANSLQVMKMCAAMAQLGHDVTLLVPRFDSEAPGLADLEHAYGVDIRFRIRWLRGWRFFGRIAWELRVLSACRKADLLFTRNARIAAGARRPVILELHQPLSDPLDRLAWRQLLKSPNLRTLVFISQRLKSLEAAGNGLGSARVTVAHSAVDAHRFDPDILPSSARAELAWPERTTAVYAGHLYEGRGVSLILALAQRFPEVQFVLIGGESAAIAEAKAMIAQCGLLNVQLIGFVANADLPRYLAAADILLMPYERVVRVSGGADTAEYCSPLKLFEYLASGRTILASRLPSIVEILNEDNALLCEPEDLPAWEAAFRIALDPKIRARLGAKARQTALQRTWVDRARSILVAAAASAEYRLGQT